ncbi:MAG TPA: pilus assembly protein [Ruminiclostridium sp.]|uniref:TadE family protein n=1 Tax=Acetivibrio saccincola TaxID=1677857 RepID=UPI000ECA8961|nr:TadE family protein [Acetivibrio saccincola]NLW25932.1 pilus assembly protein [Acetivibrio saccincola]HAA43329.1 pilus assembly protein [Ruminiclostridium sp.]HOA97278.1 pilus assembly protein [Acetivibrio saccincola]
MGFYKAWKKFLKNNKGSITVEATIIVPVVIFTVIALILIGEFLYQHSYIQSVADRTACRGAEIWNNPSKDMIMGYISKDKMKDVCLYWRIPFLESSKARNTKQSKIEEYTKYLMSRVSILDKPETLSVTARMETDYIIYKKIRVTVEAEYKNPFAPFLRVFGLKDTITIRVHSEAVVNEPVEFIRTTDFALDVVKEIDNGLFKGKGNEIVKDVRKGIGSIFEKIEEVAGGAD